ncbi:hypothetical protein BREVNS_2328 [Brevinematales bacterium NS]|nr:hypothetical protein BREVNS_2328 [Brevinematales bacterium NS]
MPFLAQFFPSIYILLYLFLLLVDSEKKKINHSFFPSEFGS